MKNRLRILLYGVAIVVGGFLYTPVHAGISFGNSLNGDTNIDNQTCWNTPQTIPGVTGKITGIRLDLKDIGYNASTSYAQILLGDLSEITSSAQTTLADGSYFFTLPTSTPNIESVGISCVRTTASSKMGPDHTGTFDIYTDGTTYTDAQVEFQDPPFTEGFQSGNFLNWSVCVNLSPNHGISTYYSVVTFGTSSPFGVGTSSQISLTGIEYVSSTSSPFYDCSSFGMTSLLNPGSYKARATAYTGSGTMFAQSKTLNFTIIDTGTTTPITQYPNTNSLYNLTGTLKTPKCTDTSFQLLGVDFGKGLCNVTTFLFIPSQSVLDDGTDLYQTVQTKIPFSYIAEIQGIINNVGSGTPASIPDIKIQTSPSSSLPNLNVSIFSSTTIASSTSRTGFSTLRTLANVLLYVGFAVMLYNTAVHLAHKKGGT